MSDLNNPNYRAQVNAAFVELKKRLLPAVLAETDSNVIVMRNFISKRDLSATSPDEVKHDRNNTRLCSCSPLRLVSVSVNCSHCAATTSTSIAAPSESTSPWINSGKSGHARTFQRIARSFWSTWKASTPCRN